MDWHSRVRLSAQRSSGPGSFRNRALPCNVTPAREGQHGEPNLHNALHDGAVAFPDFGSESEESKENEGAENVHPTGDFIGRDKCTPTDCRPLVNATKVEVSVFPADPGIDTMSDYVKEEPNANGDG